MMRYINPTGFKKVINQKNLIRLFSVNNNTDVGNDVIQHVKTYSIEKTPITTLLWNERMFLEGGNDRTSSLSESDSIHAKPVIRY